MADVILRKLPGQKSWYVNRDGVSLGIVHKVERRYSFARPRTVVEWDPVVWMDGQAPRHGEPVGTRGAAVAWILMWHARSARIRATEAVSEAALPDPLVARIEAATGVYGTDVEAVLAALREQGTRARICPLCCQDT